MLLCKRRVLAICSIAFSVAATSALADISGSSENPKAEVSTAHARVKGAVVQKRVKVAQAKRQSRSAARPARQQAVAYASAPASGPTSSAPASSSSLVAEARRYLGTNPTRRRSLWCGAFMNLVLERTGHKRGPSDLAKSFASYGQRVSGPQVGALAIMSRGRNGGHVGVVSGVDAKGNVIVVSGNHNNTVAESVYPRRRIFAYVMPRA
jgi:uncharacterized protein (TIGR02594 family)